MSQRIMPVKPERAASGYWTHPDYFVPAGDRCEEDPGEFNAWLAEHNVVYAVSWLDNELPASVRSGWNIRRGNIGAWVPAPPLGRGWFIASIHDTEQGAACIWLRYREDCTNAIPA